eukprot:CAMPEP_0182853082 /NCGR_PEP_ID=MMETSP0034_2-20130328/508_1 /TAXON_ID=156128 /ORGANISM="Nephroselmis pyriformis, Strain CCMP717" /LENGTH=285 /DNA_ID=CAMNT_0024983829 /DNA_START=254 /DNA_END=1107 /DNA_ORIENTATION=-
MSGKAPRAPGAAVPAARPARERHVPSFFDPAKAAAAPQLASTAMQERPKTGIELEQANRAQLMESWKETMAMPVVDERKLRQILKGTGLTPAASEAPEGKGTPGPRRKGGARSDSEAAGPRVGPLGPRAAKKPKGSPGHGDRKQRPPSVMSGGGAPPRQGGGAGKSRPEPSADEGSGEGGNVALRACKKRAPAMTGNVSGSMMTDADTGLGGHYHDSGNGGKAKRAAQSNYEFSGPGGKGGGAQQEDLSPLRACKKRAADPPGAGAKARSSDKPRPLPVYDGNPL